MYFVNGINKKNTQVLIAPDSPSDAGLLPACMTMLLFVLPFLFTIITLLSANKVLKQIYILAAHKHIVMQAGIDHFLQSFLYYNLLPVPACMTVYYM